MLENDLQLLLIRGTFKYESYNGVNSSNIDLSLASQHLINLLIKCKILLVEHGSDYWAINIHLEMLFEIEPAPLGRQLYKKAN